ncbi:Response regulator of zinc sigma-54-dependent two-component system [Olavius sp. associated proteobacterium Delta 1]|nr:Response regulator of zinc sigma-54-dependent two-component system [Olavius sp. associated proteobacterium Delta 1]
MKTELIGVSANIETIKKQIQKVAAAGLNTVVCGETGVGKELVVKMLFEQSPRFDNAFVKVNCAALQDTLLESEMFGYEQGAFTGAVRKMRGKFEQAHGGLLFLDEIGDMPFPLQAKLLHALQDGEFTPLGSENTFRSNVWIIAATNHDLKQDLKEEKFRADLYYRINETILQIEPLRNRPEDIPYLIKYYGEKYALEFGRKQSAALRNGMIDRLCKYHWPGNVRELQNVLRRIIILNEDEDILDSMIASNNSETVAKASFRSEPLPDLVNLLGFNGEEPKLKSLSLKEIGKRTSDFVEKQVISYVLAKTGWNRSRANKILGISYKTLLAKIHDLELTPTNPFEEDPAITSTTPGPMA